jgi:hypothetical protein
LALEAAGTQKAISRKISVRHNRAQNLLHTSTQVDRWALGKEYLYEFKLMRFRAVPGLGIC